MRWRTLPFGHFVEIQPKVSLERGNIYPFIPMENVIPFNRNVTSIETRSWDGGGGSRFQNGDTIFARITPCLEHGKTALICDITDKGGFGSTEFFVFRPRPGISDSYFVYYLACSSIIREPAIKSMVGSSGRQRAQRSVVEDISVTVPILKLQEKIASILSTYDDLIENNRRRMALLEDAARQVYQEWFVRQRFPGYEHTRIVDGVPEGWEKCSISELGDVVTGKTPSTKEEDNYGGNIMFVKTPDMHGNVYVLQTETCLTEKGANCQAGKFLPAGSLLVSCIGTVGVVSLTSERCQFNQQINAVIPSDDCLRYYCFFTFKELKPRLDAIGGGVTMANVSKGKFENMDITRPEKKLLREFDGICSPIFKQIKTLAMQNQKLRTARDLLLPKLMNGEIAV